MRDGGRLTRLDGMRGIAALAVMLFHLFPDAGLMWHGYLAVDLFFVLSGFVIARSYEPRLLAGFGIWRFAAARVLRIYPLVVAAVGAVVLLRVAYPQPRWPDPELLRQAALNALLLPDMTQAPADRFAMVSPTWSLFYEMVVNLVYAAVVTWLGRHRLMAVIAVSGVGLAVMIGTAGSAQYLHESLLGGFARTTFSFAVGVWLYRNAGRFARRPSLACYPVIMLVFALPSLGAANALYDAIAIGIVFPCVLVSGLASSRNPRLARGEEVLGELSYPVYLLHMPVAMYVGVGLGWALPPVWLSVAASVATPLTAAAAWVGYDQPLRHAIGRRLKHRTGSANVAHS